MSDVEQAVELLRSGRAVIFPTDTVYGLGVAVGCASSPQEIYALKRRDEGKPIAWLVGGVDDLQRFGRDVPEESLDLARRYWPGALTLVVRASDEVPVAFAPNGTIGLRMPASDVALALIQEVGPIAASSANRAGCPPPRSFADLDVDLAREAAFVVRTECLGMAEVPGAARATEASEAADASGVASTVIDATTPVLRVLRQGDITLPR